MFAVQIGFQTDFKEGKRDLEDINENIPEGKLTASK